MKAILLLSKMPSKCGNCPLLQQMYDDEYEEWYDMCFWRQCIIEDTERRLSVCPLKPMPQKILDRYEAPQDYRDGWNECLDEITGEENE